MATELQSDITIYNNKLVQSDNSDTFGLRYLFTILFCFDPFSTADQNLCKPFKSRWDGSRAISSGSTLFAILILILYKTIL